MGDVGSETDDPKCGSGAARSGLEEEAAGGCRGRRGKEGGRRVCPSWGVAARGLYSGMCGHGEGGEDRGSEGWVLLERCLDMAVRALAIGMPCTYVRMRERVGWDCWGREGLGVASKARGRLLRVGRERDMGILVRGT